MVRIVLLGAGSVEFTHQLSTDLFRFDDLPPLQIVLYDIDPGRLEFARVTAEQAAARFGRRADILTTLDLREALDGADHVLNVIAVGGLAATRKDLEIPARMDGYSDASWTVTERVPGAAGAGWHGEADGAPTSHATQLRAVVDALDRGDRPAVTLEDARRTLELSAAIYASSFTGRRIRAGEIAPGDPFYSSMRGTGAPWDPDRRVDDAR